MIQLHNLLSRIAFILTSKLLDYRRQQIKKPPDKPMTHDTAMVACSSTPNDPLNSIDTFEERFDHNDTAPIIGLDSLCSCHLFNSKSDSVTALEPIKPFSIQGFGGDIKAIGMGCVRIFFHDTVGVLHDKILNNIYYAPKSPVCLISIPQLARDTKKASCLYQSSLGMGLM
jgi:hypothetical protein